MDRTLFFVLVMLFCSGSVYSQTDDKDKVARDRMSELPQRIWRRGLSQENPIGSC